MIKQLATLSLAVLALASCSKKTDPQNQSLSTRDQLISQLASIKNNLNPEAQRIFDEVSSVDQEVSIVDNPNYGMFSVNPGNDIYIAGKSEPTVSITIDGKAFKAAADGQWWEQNIDFKNFYGKNLDVTIADDANSKNYKISVPKAIRAAKLSPDQSAEISRTGNTLTWDADDQFNLSKKVLLVYSLYDNDDLGNGGGCTKNDALILDDNGSYSIDDLIADQSTKRINFILVRGNTAQFVTKNKKLLFSIRCSDSHEYIVTK